MLRVYYTLVMEANREALIQKLMTEFEITREEAEKNVREAEEEAAELFSGFRTVFILI